MRGEGRAGTGQVLAGLLHLLEVASGLSPMCFGSVANKGRGRGARARTPETGKGRRIRGKMLLETEEDRS